MERKVENVLGEMCLWWASFLLLLRSQASLLKVSGTVMQCSLHLNWSQETERERDA